MSVVVPIMIHNWSLVLRLFASQILHHFNSTLEGSHSRLGNLFSRIYSWGTFFQCNMFSSAILWRMEIEAVMLVDLSLLENSSD